MESISTTAKPIRENLVAALARVPQAMKDLPNWVLWRTETDRNGRPTKLPYIAGIGLRKASSIDPRTWCSFETALTVFVGDNGAAFDGVGFCFEGSSITGIDFDDVLVEGGDRIGWADALITELGSYSEISPNDHGIHVYVLGNFDGPGIKSPEFSDGTRYEMYCRGRFFTVTGNQLVGSPGTINPFDCKALAARYKRGEIGPAEDCVAQAIRDPHFTIPQPAANGTVYDVAAFLKRHSIPVLNIRQDGGSTIYEIECQGTHGDYDKQDGRSFIKQLSSGAISYGCLHESCSDYNDRNHWRELRERYEPAPPQKIVTGRKLPPPPEAPSTAVIIGSFKAVPDMMSLDIKPIDYLVNGWIARSSLTLWAGADGTAKTFLAEHMAICVAQGQPFLGATCKTANVLYIDYENPDYVVRKRLETMDLKVDSNLKVWGGWVKQQPPQIGHEPLADIVKESEPLLVIFDPLRYGHTCDENDSTEMMAVMSWLRSYANAGASIVIVHHVAKSDGSNSRGSSAIRGAVDVALVQELDDVTGLLCLRITKNRFGERKVVDIKPDFERGTFELVDNPRAVQEAEELKKLAAIIRAEPGLSQNQVFERSTLKRNRVCELLNRYTEVLWKVQKDGQAYRYYPWSVDDKLPKKPD